MQRTIKNILLIGAVAVGLSSCKKSFLDVNTNPNLPLDVPPKTLLPGTQVAVAFANGNELGKISGLLMQYNAGISGNSQANDRWNIGSLDNQWSNELYTSAINNLGILIRKTEAQSPAYSGIAKLQLAYTFSMITDLWGNIPYSQAGQGLDESGQLKFPQARFDDQMDIYLGNDAKGIKSLFNLVREGLADLTRTSQLRPLGDDLMYGGDLTKWTRFGNSLLLKFALQVSNKVPDTTKNVINTILAGRPFIDAADGSLDANMPFTLANPNPYYMQDLGGSIRETQMLSNRFLALERSLNDSLRLLKFYNKPAATFIGYDNGTNIAAPTAANRSYYGTYVFGATRRGEAPVRLITAFRNFFILAEAALRFGTTGDPNTYYQAGIRASMKSAGLTDAQIDAYFLANPTIITLTGTTTQKLQQIITQKYVASVGNAVESYNDFRRTGYPVLTPPLQTDGDDPSVMPKRFPYTTNEGTANPNQPNPRPRTNEKVWWAL